MSIHVFYDGVKFRLKRSGEIRRFIEKVIRDENKIPGDLYFIFTGDRRIIEINREFLKHNYYTDVIAFENNEGELINGEIYISTDTVKRNAGKYSVKYREEIIRVMIHGILHLCGYSDKSEGSEKEMTEKQELLIKEFNGGR